MKEFKAGNEEALSALIDCHWGPLVQYAQQFVKSQDRAEDVVQEAFVRLWRRRESWNQTRTFRPLLYQITRNLALNEQRRMTSFRRWSRRLEWSEADSRPTPERAMRQTELQGLVQEAVDSLPDRRREVFVLVRTHQMTYREVGRVLGIAPQTVANQMTKAMQDLRTSLAPYLNTWEAEDLPFPRTQGVG